MACGMACVYLRIKQRITDDANNNILQANEVETDLGLELLTEATSNFSLTEQEGMVTAPTAFSSPLNEPHASQDTQHVSKQLTEHHVELPANKPATQ